MSSKFIYYVYAYLRLDGTPYYIGKGKGNRATSPHSYHNPPKDRSRIVYLEKNLSEIGALALERRYIRWYGRKDIGTGILMNKTDGGDGVSGMIHKEETKRRISKSAKGKRTGNKNPSFGKPAWNTGRTKKDDPILALVSKKVSATKKGTQRGDKNPFFGKNHSEETKNKMKRAWTAERKLALGLSLIKGKPQVLIKFCKDNITEEMFFSGFCRKYKIYPENIRHALRKCMATGSATTLGWTLELAGYTSESMSDEEILRHSYLSIEDYQ